LPITSEGWPRLRGKLRLKRKPRGPNERVHYFHIGWNSLVDQPTSRLVDILLRDRLHRSAGGDWLMLDKNGHGTLNDLMEEILTMTINKGQRVEHGPCSNCGMPTDINLLSLCDVCATMLHAVSRPWFEAAHEVWQAENERRIKNKRRIMGGDRHD
jgi:hypothetical protein